MLSKGPDGEFRGGRRAPLSFLGLAGFHLPLCVRAIWLPPGAGSYPAAGLSDMMQDNMNTSALLDAW